MKKIFALFLTLFLVSSVCVLSVSADETGTTADKIVATFDGGDAQVVLTSAALKDGKAEISANGSVKTEKTMQNFFALFEICAPPTGDITISFGDAGQYTVLFKNGTHDILLGNMKEPSGKTTLSLFSKNIAGDERDINIFSEEIITLKLEVMGKNVSLCAMKADEPVEMLSRPVAEMVLGEEATAGNITLSVAEGGSLTLESLKAYSLMPEIAIETENFVATEEEEPEEPVEEPMTIFGLPLLTFILISAGAVVVLGGGVTAFILIKKKRQGKSNEKIS